MIGIFGGTFNPIHLGHLITAEEVRAYCSLTKIIFIPSFRPPHKKTGQLTEAQHRLNMVKLAIADNRYFECSDIELQKKGTSYTVETLRLLLAQNPQEHYALIIGGDSLWELHTWERIEELLTLCPIIATYRPHFVKQQDDLKAALGNLSKMLKNKNLVERIELQPTTLIDIAATDIRERRCRKEPIKYLVPPAVENYIREHHLYEDSKCI